MWQIAMIVISEFQNIINECLNYFLFIFLFTSDTSVCKC